MGIKRITIKRHTHKRDLFGFNYFWLHIFLTESDLSISYSPFAIYTKGEHEYINTQNSSDGRQNKPPLLPSTTANQTTSPPLSHHGFDPRWACKALDQ